MEIVVNGRAEKKFAPDKAEFSFDFTAVDKDQAQAVRKGRQAVTDFVEKCLPAVDKQSGDLKTTGVNVHRKAEYDHNTGREKDLGFEYQQSAVLELDCDASVIGKMLDSMAGLRIPPRYFINFGLKDEDAAKAQVLPLAYDKAKEKAEAIAKAAGKSLKECVRADFRPFEETRYGGATFYAEEASVQAKGFTAARAAMDQAGGGENSFYFDPQDINISETLYCLWKTD